MFIINNLIRAVNPFSMIKTIPNFFDFLALIFINKTNPLNNKSVFTDRTDAIKQFKPHYERAILPHVQKFEQNRIAALLKFKYRLTIAAPLSIVVIVCATSLNILLPEALKVIFYTSVFIISGLSCWTARPISWYETSVKSTIFPAIFSFFGDDFQYNHQSARSVQSLQPSNILPDYNNEYTEDYVKGSYKGVSIELFEATLEHKTKSSAPPVFKGVFILLGMNKKFSSKTIIKKDSGFLGNWIEDKMNGLSNVRLEDPIFEKRFQVYSSDQVEARYLLTTSFMERLLSLGDLLSCSNLQCSFYDNQILLMLPSDLNRFETGSIFQPSTFSDEIHTILSQMDETFGMIDELKLDQRTGL